MQGEWRRNTAPLSVSNKKTNNCCFILNCSTDNVIVFWRDVLLNKDTGVYAGYSMFNNEEEKNISILGIDLVLK